MQMWMNMAVAMQMDLRRAELPMFEQHSSGRYTGDEGFVVRNQNHGTVEGLQSGFKAGLVHSVDPVGRLVEQDDIRLHREEARKADEALFAAGELVREAICKMAQTEIIQRLTRGCFCTGRRLAKIQRAETDVLENSRTEQLVVAVLKQKADAATCDTEIGLSPTGYAEKGQRSRRNRLEADQGPQKRCLARTIGADNGKLLASAKRQTCAG